ncbi:MAG: fasciclin domain-containing protein, partial [Ilumatobacteraceae bacterium]|nr:fasciclin domain-containing protein [Ilumatobacteraceae bacterium]
AGPFTVFAPNDAAFAALPAGLLDKLLLPENLAVLTSILTYHVVSGKIMSTDVMAGDAPSVEGSTIALGTTDGVQVNDATVIAADVEASNGVIHVIDKVLVPPTVDLASL